MNILVTGAAGFLGRHVARHLHESGHEVVGFDQRTVEGEVYPSIEGDLLDLDAVTAALEGKDAVCHIGAIGDVYLAAEQPDLAAAVNVTGSTNVGIAAARAGARVVYASTWEVYGEPEYQPIDERHPTRPDHPYNVSKLGGEMMLLAADHLRDVPVLALRLGTAYGTGLRPNSVFRIFIDRAMRGEPITIQGDGSQGRQFTYAGDIARAFEMACRSDVHGRAVNIVAPEMVSIRRLAELVVERFPTELTFGPPRPGDVPPSRVDSSAAEELLGWKAETAFAQGLESLFAEALSRTG